MPIVSGMLNKTPEAKNFYAPEAKGLPEDQQEALPASPPKGPFGLEESAPAPAKSFAPGQLAKRMQGTSAADQSSIVPRMLGGA